MTDKTKIIPVMEEIVAAIRIQDNNQISQSLVKLVQVSHGEGMNADQVNELLEQNGIKGGDALKNFVNEQFAAASQS